MTNDLKEIKQWLIEGKTFLYPTDTIWGIGCDASNEQAVSEIYRIKNRPDSKSLVTLVSDDAMLNRIIPEVPEIAWELFDESDKPLTLVLPNARGLASNVVAEDGSVAIRMIKSGDLHRLIYNFGRPIVSTSANISGDPSPSVEIETVSDEIRQEVNGTAELAGLKMTGKSSSIIKVEVDGRIKIIRP